MSALRLGSLFSGIGGIELGLERTGGFQTVFQVEQDEFCRRVLAKHWPDVPRFNDVREVGAHNLPACDVLCGGFPCQDISNAGRRKGIDGERSGLWSEYARIIREIRPRFVFVENVTALLGRGLEKVLGDLAESGYDAEWDCIPAAAIGAPHRRDRVWIVAYPNADQQGLQGRLRESVRERAGERPAWPVGASAHVSDADNEGESGGAVDDVSRVGVPEPAGSHEWWGTEPDVGRVANGVPARVDRLKSLGNAVVPQVAEYIGHRILAFHKAQSEAA